MNELINSRVGKGIVIEEPLIFELPPSKSGLDFSFDFGEKIDSIESKYLKDDHILFSGHSEVDVVRHFTRLSYYNFGVDTGFYPLGSCTMKYNPKISEEIASKDIYLNLHPELPDDAIQGALEIIYSLSSLILKITGMDAISLIPAAGAHGEFTGIKIIQKYLYDRGDRNRNIILVPDSAHGTNPASSAFASFKVVEIPTRKYGVLKPDVLKEYLSSNVAALMITNPNTLGLLEEDIREISKLLHDNGSILYMDGANLNALLGIVDIKALGVDIMHINLHKTFGAPHGGGGPGAGPVCVVSEFEEYLPNPKVEFKNDRFVVSEHSSSIGWIKPFFGHFGVYIKSLVYILSLGSQIKNVAYFSVLNANYIKKALKDYFHLPFEDKRHMHEVVFTDKYQKEHGIKTLDIAKALMDFGIHPPTVYFPLVVDGAIMVEPTDTETKREMDYFIDVMKTIAEISKEEPHLLKELPKNTYRKRVDEVKAAKELILVYGKRFGR